MTEDTKNSERCERVEVRVARLEERVKAAESARTIAKIELDRHMEQLNDVRLRFVDKSSYEREHSDVRIRIEELERGRAGAMGIVGAYGRIIAFLLAAISLWASLRTH